ncbi:hypothetical protein BKA63DRAFT_493986 [Paraphoma chrysanthemicola]|nr:hypothetical protein BKA63DRAFT_493986 [Paraphoma chrysanthemicola]
MSFASPATADAKPAFLHMRPKWSLTRIINTNSHLPRPIIVRLLDHRLTRPSRIAQTTTARRDEARQRDAHKRRGIPYEPECFSSSKSIERPLRFPALRSEIDSKAVRLTHLNSLGPAMNEILLTLLQLLRDESSPKFEQSFDFFKSHLQHAEPLLRHLGSWAKDSNWDWKSSVQIDFASGAPPQWGVEIDTNIEMAETPVPSSPVPDQSSLPSGGSDNDFSAPDSRRNNLAAIEGSEGATSSFDTSINTTASSSGRYDSALISNFDTFLGLYTHPGVSIACQREIDRLNEKRGSLHSVDLSQHFLEPFIISVRTFLAHTDWSYYHAEYFARNASSWIQLTVDLREALKNERWVWETLGRDLWVLRRDLIKVGIVVSEQLGMLPEQHQSVHKRPCDEQWEARQTLYLDLLPGFTSTTVPGADMDAHTIQSTGATQTDVLPGLNAFDPNNVHRNTDLLAIFSHPTFRALISTSLANLRHSMAEKETTATIDAAFLRRACEFFTRAYKQMWFRWQKFEKNDAVQDCKQQLNKVRDDLVEVGPGHNTDEARALKGDIDDLIDVLEGK